MGGGHPAGRLRSHRGHNLPGKRFFKWGARYSNKSITIRYFSSGFDDGAPSVLHTRLINIAIIFAIFSSPTTAVSYIYGEMRVLAGCTNSCPETRDNVVGKFHLTHHHHRFTQSVASLRHFITAMHSYYHLSVAYRYSHPSRLLIKIEKSMKNKKSRK